ncbi:MULTISPECIES: Rieske 2Fe-2S domain-containing protein [Sphingomonadales]|uniref:(2Fe-2S)-binding protein n=2 Tax=Edaphosphingomonas TaxID=3423724 RepID=A0A2T4I479_9SPHN|nr:MULTISPECIES: Rieske 2Fe-2S domain-containing protein [Sphingomonas]AGH50596.1 Rieske (2Fe-2S) domain-containing protein [Sphingomonas sp. MM-1]MDX3883780.1 Rieske 2Fe-2S domain-containing protein [Sphingomonas sp.]OHT19026.1 3-ketosteroid-9-alpha-monooxygenase oxygenase subunit [Sphingomonas haloaromaticamans]PTD24209.1 (2Fe-2S)-binding protein [Sphingomonas fennica]
MATTAEYGLGEQTFPRGWFMVADADELEGTKPLAVRYFGRDMVLYRGESGALHMVDAYCPHMGAHLARNTTSYVIRDGKQVEGDSIRCPYHGWRFGPDGRCNQIPYSPQKVPGAAKLESWLVKERAGCIWMWWDPEGGEPEYDLPEFAEYGAPHWVNWKMDRLGLLNSHPVEIVDNMADRAHFEPIHGTQDVILFENDFEDHKVVQRMSSGHRTLSAEGGEPLFTDTWYTGPGILISQMAGQFPSIILITHTPVDDGVVKVWHGLLVKVAGAVPSEEEIGMARAYQQASCDAFSQDFEVWANKRPCFNPMAVLGDGPIGKLRIWYRQFYNPRARAQEFRARVNGTIITRGTLNAPWDDQQVA